MKKCPFCAEEIQDEAIVCRFCGRDLDVPTNGTSAELDRRFAMIQKFWEQPIYASRYFVKIVDDTHMEVYARKAKKEKRVFFFEIVKGLVFENGKKLSDNRVKDKYYVQ